MAAQASVAWEAVLGSSRCATWGRGGAGECGTGGSAEFEPQSHLAHGLQLFLLQLFLATLCARLVLQRQWSAGARKRGARGSKCRQLKAKAAGHKKERAKGEGGTLHSTSHRHTDDSRWLLVGSKGSSSQCDADCNCHLDT